VCFVYGFLLVTYVLCQFCNSPCAVSLLNAELNPMYHLLALLGAHHILHVSRIRVKLARY